jgi:predicted DNA-binding transcriptional regulator YafY
MPPRLRRRVETLRAATVAPAWSGGERTDREVEPLRLVSLRRRWYLVAYDLGRQDWRSFRLDRHERPVATGVQFRPRELPAADAAAFVHAGLENLPVTYAVEALVDAPAADVRRRIGAWAAVEPVDDRRSRVRMNSDTLAWPAVALADLDADFLVVGPPGFLDYLRDAGARFARAATSPLR